MELQDYRKKRHFDVTEEPRGSEASRNAGERGLLYVIQQHHARRLHWDLRLERDGVLKSWAVPKEPPRGPGERRLAVEVEDHPIEYGDFEGVIPESEYGAGTVEIWDRGTYTPVKWEDDEIIVDIHGEKLSGRYVMIRFQPEKDRKNWLFFKKKE
jgi:DNA ligase D-like protein (predicted 3'-phosphoesterase)